MKGFPKLRVYDPGRKVMGGKSNMVYLKSIEQMDDGVYLRFKRHLEDDENLKYMWGTGLKDDNGKEICDGDIVKAESVINHIVGVVRFGKYEQDGSGGEYGATTCMGFYVERVKVIPSDWEKEIDCIYEPEEEKESSLFTFEGLEILGNIYENPELLEVQEDDNDL